MEPAVLIVFGAILLLVVIGLVVRGRIRPHRDTVATATTAAPPRSALGAAVRRALGAGLDEPAWISIEEALIAADVGVNAASDVVARVRRAGPADPDEARRAIADSLRAEMAGKDREFHLGGSPAVVLVVGVNGSGKTTSIAKLGKTLQDEGRKVVFAAADTFRAAAAEQLLTWGQRLGVQVVRGQEGGDPASVVYDAIQSATAGSADVVVVDTAGRLHGKKNLMAELEKIYRVAGGNQVDEVLLVLDATAGQNGLAQVSEFSRILPISGIVLAKLDGTARGGIVVAVERTLGVPVKFVGVGEGLDDLEPFDPDRFVDSLLE